LSSDEVAQVLKPQQGASANGASTSLAASWVSFLEAQAFAEEPQGAASGSELQAAQTPKPQTETAPKLPSEAAAPATLA